MDIYTAKKLILGLVAIAVAAVLATAPASARGFSLYGSYWDTDQAGEAVGGGLSFEIPINERVGVDLRGAWYSQGELENPFDEGDTFTERDLNLAPVEAGLRFNFNPSGTFSPYVGGGFSYIFMDLDSDRFEVDDETGWYALGGARIGDGAGVDLLAEIAYRKAEATVSDSGLTPVDEFDLEEDVALDIDGPGVNLGVVWNF